MTITAGHVPNGQFTRLTLYYHYPGHRVVDHRCIRLPYENYRIVTNGACP